jgi:hypothetical protein
MARRTAMSKEPRTESSRKGPPDRNSNIRRLPGKPIDRLTRVSPGVYRNSQGKLVGSQGQSLGRRDNRPGDAIRNALGDMTNPGNRMPAGRPGQQTPPVMTNPGARTPAARPGQQALPVEMPQGWLPEWQRLQQSPGNMGEQFANQVTRPNPNFEGIVRDAAGQLAQNNMANQIGQTMGNMQMQPGYLPNTQNKPMPWGPQMDPGYYNPRFQRRIEDLAYRSPAGQAPTPEQLQQAFQPVQLQQPNSVSGLLRRGR